MIVETLTCGGKVVKVDLEKEKVLEEEDGVQLFRRSGGGSVKVKGDYLVVDDGKRIEGFLLNRRPEDVTAITVKSDNVSEKGKIEAYLVGANWIEQASKGHVREFTGRIISASAVKQLILAVTNKWMYVLDGKLKCKAKSRVPVRFPGKLYTHVDKSGNAYIGLVSVNEKKLAVFDDTGALLCEHKGIGQVTACAFAESAESGEVFVCVAESGKDEKKVSIITLAGSVVQEIDTEHLERIVGVDCVEREDGTLEVVSGSREGTLCVAEWKHWARKRSDADGKSQRIRGEAVLVEREGLRSVRCAEEEKKEDLA